MWLCNNRTAGAGPGARPRPFFRPAAAPPASRCSAEVQSAVSPFCNRQRIGTFRCSSVLLSLFLAAFVPAFTSKAKEKWPKPTEEARRQAEAEKRHEAEVWAHIEPEVLAWTNKGKPYIPWAAKPEDLPQTGI